MHDLSNTWEQWEIAQMSTEGARLLWDQFAQSQSRVIPVSPETDRPLAIVVENGMADASSQVLDLGCGNGRFALWFAQHCSRVTGIDLSEKALEIARGAADGMQIENLTLVADDWHSLRLEDYGWVGAFDLVFCNTSPAVQSAETFKKLIRASRGWCYMSKPTHRAEAVTRYLCRELKIDHWHRPFEWDMMHAFDWLYMEGYEPRVDYTHENWKRSRTVDQAANYYTAWLAANYGLPLSRGEEVRAALRKLAVDDMIEEADATTISILYWNVNR